MAANTIPIFEESISHQMAAFATANTNRDGTGTIADLFTPGVDGGRVEVVVINAIVATTVGVVRLWVYDGTNWRLLKEILVTAITPSTTIAVYTATYTPEATDKHHLALQSGYKLGVSTHIAESFVAHAFGRNY